MNILVVGGTGFFGIPMVEKLIADGHDVTIATRGKTKHPFQDSTKQIIMDRTDYESVKKALSDRVFDVIIDKIAFCSNDVKNLLENGRCKKYIQMSSGSVYYETQGIIKEESFNPCNHKLVWMNFSINDYDECKRQAERAALEYLDISQCIFVRYPVVMGPHDYTGRLKFYVDHILEEKPMFVDDLDCPIAFISEKEAGNFIAHLVNQKVNGGINVSSKGMISTRDIIKYIETKTGKKAVLYPNGDFAPYNGYSEKLAYDTTKAESTGFQFSNIDTWIYDLIDLYLENK